MERGLQLGGLALVGCFFSFDRHFAFLHGNADVAASAGSAASFPVATRSVNLLPSTLIPVCASRTAAGLMVSCGGYKTLLTATFLSVPHGSCMCAYRSRRAPACRKRHVQQQACCLRHACSTPACPGACCTSTHLKVLNLSFHEVVCISPRPQTLLLSKADGRSMQIHCPADHVWQHGQTAMRAASVLMDPASCHMVAASRAQDCCGGWWSASQHRRRH